MRCGKLSRDEIAFAEQGVHDLNVDSGERLKHLEEQLVKYRAKLAQKKRVFRGVKHEDSLSELRYTEYMVYKDMVEGLEREIREIKTRLASG